MRPMPGPPAGPRLSRRSPGNLCRPGRVQGPSPTGEDTMKRVTAGAGALAVLLLAACGGTTGQGTTGTAATGATGTGTVTTGTVTTGTVTTGTGITTVTRTTIVTGRFLREGG